MKAEDITSDGKIILLDVGNTNIKWTWLDTMGLGEITSLSHQEQDIDRLLSQEWSAVAAPVQAYISSVAGQDMDNKLQGWMRRHWSLEPSFVRSRAAACGVKNSYREPERLGVDRWLSMLALHARFPGPACVVDCGSAVTIDAIGLAGQHLGGLILPGFGLMRQALAEHTAIALVGATKPRGLLARDTESAIAAGGVNAVAALVERIVREVAAESNAPVELVLTGGDAGVLQDALSMSSRIEPNLVLQGLIEIIRDGTD